jgi:hypothetical protein
MPHAPELIALASYLAGEFTNQEQALAEPAWYVHLHLWHRPVKGLFPEGITLFAEQANILKLDQPYRQRLLQLRETAHDPLKIQVQYYKILQPTNFRGAGANPALLNHLTPEQVELLPDGVLKVAIDQPNYPDYSFTAMPASDRPCSFSYDNKTYQVQLGFAASPEQFLSYDKGINPSTGKAIWGAILGAYRFTKQSDFVSLPRE